jgi:hypothetical protein
MRVLRWKGRIKHPFYHQDGYLANDTFVWMNFLHPLFWFFCISFSLSLSDEKFNAKIELNPCLQEV